MTKKAKPEPLPPYERKPGELVIELKGKRIVSKFHNYYTDGQLKMNLPIEKTNEPS